MHITSCQFNPAPPHDDVCSIYEMTTRTPIAETLVITRAGWLTVHDRRNGRHQHPHDPRGFAAAFGSW